MKPSARIALGIIVGSLITLIADPRSRPVALGVLIEQGRSKIMASTALIPQNHYQLPPPESLADAGVYMQVGATLMAPGHTSSELNLDTLLKVAEHAAVSEPSNAFWKQMIAVFEWKRGRQKEARAAWLKAATCDTWKDYQPERLVSISKSLGNETGTEMAWHRSRALMLRSDACANVIRQTGIQLISRSSTTSVGGLLVRYATLENGRLLRDGARTISAGQSGVALIELASMPPGMRVPERSPRKLITSRLDLVNHLRSEGFPDEARLADRAFSVNDAWNAFLSRDAADETAQRLAITSILTASLPSALLITSLIGIALYAFSAALVRWPILMNAFRIPLAPMIGAAAALVLYMVTDLWLVALAAVLCIGFVGFGPTKTRTKPPSDLGPLFNVACGTLVTVFIGLVSIFFVGLTKAAAEVSEFAQIPDEYVGGGTLPLGLAFIVLCLLMVAAPCWAFVQRIATGRALTFAFKQFGSFTMWACLVSGILAVPTSMFVDNRTQTQLTQILSNEPNYYIYDARYSGSQNKTDR